MFQKRKEKPKEKNEVKQISNQTKDKGFKVMIIRVVTKLRRMDEHRKNFTKDIENIKKSQTEWKTTITEMKST